MNVEKKTLSALKWTAAARLAGQSASWVATLFVLRILAPEDYGLMAIVSTLIAIGTAIAEFGLANSMIQARTLEQDVKAKLAGLIVVLHVALAVVTCGIAPLAAWFFDDARLTALIQTASLQFGFAAAAGVPHALATREMQFALLARVELLTMVLGSVGTLGLAILGIGAWALVGGMLITSATRALLLVARGENVRPSFKFAGLGAHLSYSTRMASSHVAWSVASQSDMMVGGRVLTRDALGAYSVALHLATLPMSKIMGIINQIAFTAVARLQDESERLRARLMQGSRMLTVLAVGLMWGLAGVAPEFLTAVLGAKWHAAIVPLQLISLIVPLRMLTMILATAVAGVGAAHINLRNTITTAIVWPACFIIGAQWGPIGMAAAWLVAVPLAFGLNARRICGALGLRFGSILRFAVPPALAGCAMLAVIFALRFVTDEWSHWQRLPLLISGGGAAYVAALLAIDRQTLTDLRNLGKR